jgi:hypothetical protein
MISRDLEYTRRGSIRNFICYDVYSSMSGNTNLLLCEQESCDKHYGRTLLARLPRSMPTTAILSFSKFQVVSVECERKVGEGLEGSACRVAAEKTNGACRSSKRVTFASIL